MVHTAYMEEWPAAPIVLGRDNTRCFPASISHLALQLDSNT
jgi:hypothetical protein